VRTYSNAHRLQGQPARPEHRPLAPRRADRAARHVVPARRRPAGAQARPRGPPGGWCSPPSPIRSRARVDLPLEVDPAARDGRRASPGAWRRRCGSSPRRSPCGSGIANFVVPSKPARHHAARAERRLVRPHLRRCGGQRVLPQARIANVSSPAKDAGPSRSAEAGRSRSRRRRRALRSTFPKDGGRACSRRPGGGRLASRPSWSASRRR